MISQVPHAAEAVRVKGPWKAYKWLVLRRASQFGFLALFLLGPLAGVWLVVGNLGSSRTLDVLPLTDPYVLLQSFAAGHLPETTALIGGAIVFLVYALIGGRMYCAWVCPVNIVTDAAYWVRERFGVDKGWQPKRATRLWVLAMTLVVSAVTGTIAWEAVNPVSMVHRGLVFGMGFAWMILLAVFVFDLFVSRRGWCGHLCPVGAFYGLIGSASLLRVSAKRRERCDDCMSCFAVCPEPHVITPSLKRGERADSPVILARDCTNCGRCIDVCALDVFTFTHRFDQSMEAAPMAPAETCDKAA
jgi:ferredoxin-type protein NapH